MAIVTNIKKTRRSGQFAVFVDGQETFGLGSNAIASSGLAIGQEISDKEIELFKQVGQEDQGYDLATRYILVRPRSRHEVHDYLRRKGSEDSVIEKVLSRLETGHLINDQQFAVAWMSSRQLSRPRSKRHLMGELRSRGLSGDDIAEAIKDVGPDEEYQSLARLIQKKQKLAQYQQPQKLMGYLVRQGYEYDLVKKVLDEMGQE